MLNSDIVLRTSESTYIVLKNSKSTFKTNNMYHNMQKMIQNAIKKQSKQYKIT